MRQRADEEQPWLLNLNFTSPHWPWEGPGDKAVSDELTARLLAGETPGLPVMCVSGRIGFEIVQKAVAAGVGVLAAIGAPSSLAVRLAEEAGLGLVGFLSASRFVVYAGGDRIGV